MREIALAQPRQKLLEPTRDRRAAEGPGGDDRPILLVEHYRPLARPILRGLEEEGIVAHLAGDDVEADALARTMPYSAVVVDWHIPRSGGVALVRGWRRDGLVAPVLMFMPSASAADVLEAVDAGVDDLLPLPFSLDDLLARLRAWSKQGVEGDDRSAIPRRQQAGRLFPW